MRRFLLDTNVCLAIIRGHQIYNRIKTDLALDGGDSILIISIVTKAELLSLGKRNNWGDKKMNILNKILENFVIIDINNSDHKLIEAYYTIDAYSQGNLEEIPLNDSARNMGKNDLWIAATAYAANAQLITTDGDFDHLNNSNFLTVHKFLPN